MDTAALQQLLTGQYVRLWPYAPTLFPRDLLARVWHMIEAERGWPRLFWWQRIPDAEKGALGFFAAHMAHCTPVLVQHLATEQLAGLIWFDEDFPGLRCNISIWYARAAWGAPAHEASALATRYAHQALGFPAVWGITPWRAAYHHALRCGYKPMASFPAYVRIHDRAMPLHFLCHEE